MPQELKITMLGASGVGKTSILTAMYEQFTETFGKANLQLIPDLESSALLQERLAQLKSLSNDFNAKAGIENTERERSFIFDLGKKGQKPFVRLQFYDFPGTFLQTNTTQNNLAFVKDLLTKSSIVVIAIDTPALMGKNGKWHHSINRPDQIKNFFQNVYQDINSPRLVLFVPVRCESYLQDFKSSNALLINLKSQYSQLFNLFNSPALLPWVASVVTPVQTVGNVVFNSIREINDQPYFSFNKTSHDAEYSPKNAEQLLRCILRFMLKIQMEERNWHWGPFSPIRTKLGLDNDIKEAAIHTTLYSQYDWGFTLIQGNKWLDI